MTRKGGIIGGVFFTIKENINVHNPNHVLTPGGKIQTTVPIALLAQPTTTPGMQGGAYTVD